MIRNDMKIAGVCVCVRAHVDDLGDPVYWRFRTLMTNPRQLRKKAR